MRANQILEFGDYYKDEFYPKTYHVQDLENDELMDTVSRIHINSRISTSELEAIADALKKRPQIDFRLYKNAFLNEAEWELFSHIRKLWIRIDRTLQSLNFLEKIPMLEKLAIEGSVEEKNPSLLPLQLLKNLKWLNLVDIQQDINQIVWPGALNHLGVTIPKLKEADFLSKIPAIHNLGIHQTKIKDYSFLINIPDLRVLWLSQLSNFNDDDSKLLSKMKDLQLVYLSRCKRITNLDFVPEVNELKILKIDHINIASFDPLSQSPQLNTLSASYVTPLDKRIDGLLNLKHVYFGGDIPKDEVARFKKEFKGIDAVIGPEIIKGNLAANEALFEMSYIYQV
ncbi:hypothetical protein DVR12_12750 [Chitinophaga silvatica]|uniref:Leucine-rich repeat domain-containing protein n=1 Tax=Chitinophaga silvatica TaxID=2282649 RepID=A0A3E1YAB7_9BACT|nr:hypothetical protein [Chitinophaga silvatica]RFS22659.1 hypothetical protein DVR12_12750 [Chitinophaga silvatica]